MHSKLLWPMERHLVHFTGSLQINGYEVIGRWTAIAKPLWASDGLNSSHSPSPAPSPYGKPAVNHPRHGGMNAVGEVLHVDGSGKEEVRWQPEEI